jgi:hypothetical protein
MGMSAYMRSYSELVRSFSLAVEFGSYEPTVTGSNPVRSILTIFYFYFHQ